MKTIVDLYKETCGFEPERKTSREYCAPCPSCGGRDRFSLILENEDKLDRFFCRQCGMKGDAISFLREFKGMSYKDACIEIGIQPKEYGAKNCRLSTWQKKTDTLPTAPPCQEWTPLPEDLPSPLWRAAAQKFAKTCSLNLSNPACLSLLAERGLKVETMQRLSAGWNSQKLFAPPVSWGFSAEDKKLLLPPGLVLPVRRRAGIINLQIRRADVSPGERTGRFFSVRGHSEGFFVLGTKGKPVILLESVLDAILVFQEAGDLIASIALLGADKRPSREVVCFLQEAPLILLCLDNDDAGKENCFWWKQHFPRAAVHCAPAPAKDPGDLLALGFSVREWIRFGLWKHGQPLAKQTPPSEHTEKVCLAPPSSGLDSDKADTEAEPFDALKTLLSAQVKKASCPLAPPPLPPVYEAQKNPVGPKVRYEWPLITESREATRRAPENIRRLLRKLCSFAPFVEIGINYWDSANLIARDADGDICPQAQDFLLLHPELSDWIKGLPQKAWCIKMPYVQWVPVEWERQRLGRQENSAGKETN